MSQTVTQPFDYLLRLADTHYYVIPTTCHYLNNLIGRGIRSRFYRRGWLWLKLINNVSSTYKLFSKNICIVLLFCLIFVSTNRK